MLVAAVRAADEKLAEDIVVLDVGEALSVVDFFIITSGRNTRQVATIVEEIEASIKRHTGRSPIRVEGLRDATWVLMDYGDIIIHVFLDETREYYDLEHLWSATPRLSTTELLGRSSSEIA
jgi:ribosome-associated protein